MDDSLTSINVGHGDARRVEVVHISTILTAITAKGTVLAAVVLGCIAKAHQVKYSNCTTE